jgi:hypothetical protein
MEQILRFSDTVPRDPRIDAWFASGDELRRMALPWFEQMRGRGADVRETLNDGHPNACVGDAPFAYVAAFKANVNVGFFYGATLDDPHGLLEGSGKRMRHVKLRWGKPVHDAALEALIAAAYRDIRERLSSSDQMGRSSGL